MLPYLQVVFANLLFHAFYANLFFILLISVISGPLNEEFGWRGYALDSYDFQLCCFVCLH